MMPIVTADHRMDDTAAFEQAYRDDDNHWWYSQSGDCQNAYDVALEELDGLRAAVARVRALCDPGDDRLTDRGKAWVRAALDGPTSPPSTLR